MGVTLIITEKPSVAAEFAKALGGLSRKNGYFEGSDYLVTFAVGHLLELYEPQDYDSKYGKWTLEDLPIVPDRFKHKPIPDTKEQYEIVHQLIQRPDVSDLILATDAGREGELIGRLILGYAGKRDFSQVRRFWQSEALSHDVVTRGLSQAKPATAYDRLFHEGFFRQHADWLTGINLSRLFSVELEATFSVGRVQTAVLGLIVDRDRERSAFQGNRYWKVYGLFNDAPGAEALRGWAQVGDEGKLYQQAQAQDLLATLVDHDGVVLERFSEEKRRLPPKLFNLTALQKAANAKFGMSADRTLEIAQSLYETHKVLSYPRTPSRVMGSADLQLVADVLARWRQEQPDLFGVWWDPSSVSVDNERVFNDAELEDHHALIPLAPLGESAASDERDVFSLVVQNFVQVFSRSEEYIAGSLTIGVGETPFLIRAREVTDPGWTAVGVLEDDAEPSDEVDSSRLPDWQVGQNIPYTEFGIIEDVTRAKPAYTDRTLLSVMEQPNRVLGDSEERFARGTGLGTPATRAAIIRTLLQRGYITRSYRKLLATEKGTYLIDRLRETPAAELTDVSVTANWERRLAENPSQFFAEQRQWVISVVNELKSQPRLAKFEQTKESLGPCPVCGRAVHEGKKSYHCASCKRDDCHFSIWKTIAGATVTKLTVKRLLSGQKSSLLTMRSKAGKEFKARLVLHGTKVEFSFDQYERPKPSAAKLRAVRRSHRSGRR